MKLSDYANQMGLKYLTVWKMYREGKLPCRAEQLPTGTILVFPDELPTQDLITRVERLEENVEQLRQRMDGAASNA